MSSQIPHAVTRGKPPRTPEEEAFLAIVLASDALTRSVEQFLRRHGLSFAQYNVLRILRGAGREGASCSQIGERLITSEPDVTRLLDRMDKHGWIRRERGAGDRRRVTTRITAPGRKLLERLDEPVCRLHRRQFVPLAQDRIESLITALEEVRAGLTQAR